MPFDDEWIRTAFEDGVEPIILISLSELKKQSQILGKSIQLFFQGAIFGFKGYDILRCNH